MAGQMSMNAKKGVYSDASTGHHYRPVRVYNNLTSE